MRIFVRKVEVESITAYFRPICFRPWGFLISLFGELIPVNLHRRFAKVVFLATEILLLGYAPLFDSILNRICVYRLFCSTKTTSE